MTLANGLVIVAAAVKPLTNTNTMNKPILLSKEHEISAFGGAYGHPHWAVVSLYRRSNSRELAKNCANQIADLVSQ